MMTATFTDFEPYSRKRSYARSPSASAIITCDDRRKLGSLIFDAEFGADSRVLHVLEARLEDADYVEQDEIPGDVVTMNSIVDLLHLGTRQVECVRLAYPWDAELADDAISVLDPLGTALLGSSAGSIVQCRDRSRTTKFRIERVVQAQHADWL